MGLRLFQARSALERRLGRRVPQTEVGDALGVHGVTVGGWETGKSEPSLAMLEQLAAYYGVDPATLAFGTGGALPDGLKRERPAITAAEALAAAQSDQKRRKGRG